jgi:hypothetical protein
MHTLPVQHGSSRAVPVTDQRWARIRRAGVPQLLALGGLLLDLGQVTAAQAMLEGCILLNLAGYNGNEKTDAGAETMLGLAGGRNGNAPLMIRALAPQHPGLLAFVEQLRSSLDALERPRADIDPRPAPSLPTAHPALAHDADGYSSAPGSMPAPLATPSSRSTKAGTTSTARSAHRSAASPKGPGAGKPRFFADGVDDIASPTGSARGRIATATDAASTATGAGVAPALQIVVARRTEAPPLVAGHTPWDVPVLSAADILNLALGKSKQVADALKRQRQRQHDGDSGGDGGDGSGESGGGDGGSGAIVTLHGRMHPSVVSRLLRDDPSRAALRPLVLTRQAQAASSAALDVDAVIRAVSSRLRAPATSTALATSASLPALNRALASRGLPPIIAGKPSLGSKPGGGPGGGGGMGRGPRGRGGAGSASMMESRSMAALTDVLRSAAPDEEEAVDTLVKIFAGGDGSSGAGDAPGGAGGTAAGGAPAAIRISRPGDAEGRGSGGGAGGARPAGSAGQAGGVAGSGSESAREADAAAAAAEEARAAALLALATADVANAELLAVALCKLAGVLLGRLQAYKAFVVLQVAAAAAAAAAAQAAAEEERQDRLFQLQHGQAAGGAPEHDAAVASSRSRMGRSLDSGRAGGESSRRGHAQVSRGPADATLSSTRAASHTQGATVARERSTSPPPVLPPPADAAAPGAAAKALSPGRLRARLARAKAKEAEPVADPQVQAM